MWSRRVIPAGIAIRYMDFTDWKGITMTYQSTNPYDGKVFETFKEIDEIQLKENLHKPTPVSSTTGARAPMDNARRYCIGRRR